MRKGSDYTTNVPNNPKRTRKNIIRTFPPNTTSPPLRSYLDASASISARRTRASASFCASILAASSLPLARVIWRGEIPPKHGEKRGEGGGVERRETRFSTYVCKRFFFSCRELPGTTRLNVQPTDWFRSADLFFFSSVVAFFAFFLVDFPRVKFIYNLYLYIYIYFGWLLNIRE